MPSLLVTNDFPPKVGGIQSYLHELWRRLPPDDTHVFTTPQEGARNWDAEQKFNVVRAKQKVLLPTRKLARDVDALARELDADVIFLDPMMPLGLIGPHLRAAPYIVIAHGAEITVPRRLPGSHALGRRVMRGAAAVVAAGTYPAVQSSRIAGRELRGLIIPPGVDVERFHPRTDEERRATRERYGLDPSQPLVLGLSRLVPRKGFDVVIDVVVGLDNVHLAIAGGGRDRNRLEQRARDHKNVSFLGPIPEAELPDVYACADVFAMCCRERWAGLEAEGFGIVFLEAAACGVPAVAGRSGGAHEAVADGETGFVVAPTGTAAVRSAIARFAREPDVRAAMGVEARRRAVREFAYDALVERLVPLAAGDLSGTAILPR